MRILERQISDAIKAALADTPVVVVNGARQVGKSTLVHHLGLTRAAKYATLDDDAHLAAARLDPRVFVEQPADPLIIDEVQLEPRLFRAVKAAVDRDRRPGRFLLTGSSRLLAAPDMAEALAGRVEIIELWPFSQSEIEGAPDGWIDVVFTDPASLLVGSTETRQGYFDRIARGGYPEVLTRTAKRRKPWFDAYTTTVAQRVVREVADIERQAEIPRILALCAARTASELNVRSLATDVGIPARTLDSYLAHLANVFLIQLIPAWTTNLSAKVIRRPKILMVDSGLACHLLGVDLDARSPEISPALGSLVETFVGSELRRQLTWADERASLFHFRDRGGQEVDFVLESPDGRVVGVEVKATSSPTTKDFTGLRFLETRLGARFHYGAVLHLGPDAIPFGPRLAALPLSSLWTAEAPSRELLMGSVSEPR